MKFLRVLLPGVLLAGSCVFVACHRQDASDNKANEEAQKPTVNFIMAERQTAPTKLTLPGALQAFQDTPIFARTSGYIEKWFFDIGDHVKTGDTLALIEAPDLDQELNQAKAALAQTEANLDLARVSADRWKALGQQHAVSQQDVDTRVAEYEARQADTKAARANVDRLAQLKAYQSVTAPYDGVVSARNAQIGALVTNGTGTELFHLAQVDPLRVYVNVPQTYVRSIEPGLNVQVHVPEFRDDVFKGKVVRFAGALDPASRTLLVEVQLPNPDQRLFPGMFCEVNFTFAPSEPAIIIPSNAAIVRGDGTSVATVTDQNRIHLQPVRLGRDFGTQIEILAGLEPGQRVVSNPSDALSEGMEVQAQSEKAEQQKEKQEEQKRQNDSKSQNKNSDAEKKGSS